MEGGRAVRDVLLSFVRRVSVGFCGGLVCLCFVQDETTNLFPSYCRLLEAMRFVTHLPVNTCEPTLVRTVVSMSPVKRITRVSVSKTEQPKQHAPLLAQTCHVCICST